MLKKIYKELVEIRKELHAIRNGMEFFSKTGTNLDDKPTAESARISAVLNDITSKHYQGV